MAAWSIVVFDSDIYHKPDVEGALKALYRLLRDKAASQGWCSGPRRIASENRASMISSPRAIRSRMFWPWFQPMGPLPLSPAQRNGHAMQPVSRADPLLTDTSNAAAFVADHGPLLRYCYPWKTWLVWTGTHWQRDTSGEVMRLAKQTVKNLVQRINRPER